MRYACNPPARGKLYKHWESISLSYSDAGRSSILISESQGPGKIRLRYAPFLVFIKTCPASHEEPDITCFNLQAAALASTEIKRCVWKSPDALDLPLSPPPRCFSQAEHSLASSTKIRLIQLKRTLSEQLQKCTLNHITKRDDQS